MVSRKAGVAPGTSHLIEGGAAVSASSRDQEYAAGFSRCRTELRDELVLNVNWPGLAGVEDPMRKSEGGERSR